MKKSAAKKAVKKAAKKVGFQYKADPGSYVFLAGSFNQWNPQAHPLGETSVSGLFKTQIVLPPGKHEYKFVVNGEWQVDPNCTDFAPNDLGTPNSVISVE